MSVVIYHNPRCSKSRQALALLRERGVEPQIIEYLEAPPTADEFAAILDKLGMEPRGVLRRREAAYRREGLDNPALDRSRLIRAMVANPILIERPIVLANGRAALGRPPEAVLEIL